MTPQDTIQRTVQAWQHADGEAYHHASHPRLGPAWDSRAKELRSILTCQLVATRQSDIAAVLPNVGHSRELFLDSLRRAKGEVVAIRIGGAS